MYILIILYDACENNDPLMKPRAGFQGKFSFKLYFIFYSTNFHENEMFFF